MTGLVRNRIIQKKNAAAAQPRAMRASFIHRYLETLLTTVSFTHWYFGAYHTDRIIPPRYTALFSRVTAAQNPSTEE